MQINCSSYSNLQNKRFACVQNAVEVTGRRLYSDSHQQYMLCRVILASFIRDKTVLVILSFCLQLSLYCKVAQPCRDKEDICFTFKQIQINLPFIHLGNSINVVWGYCGQEYHRSSGNVAEGIFPGILGLCSLSRSSFRV